MAKPNLVRRIAAKSPHTLAYRSWQEARLAAMKLCGGWKSLEISINDWATNGSSSEWLRSGDFALLAKDGATALRRANQHGSATAGREVAAGDATIDRRISIFGSPIPQAGAWPWHEDWRFNHAWPRRYFRSYDHGAPRRSSYDVKFPWELSRLGFLISLVQADVIDGGQRTRTAFRIIKDWTNNNPLAHSVNWYPMEAAIRAINLCIFADMARQGPIDEDQATQLLRTLAAHGEFIERTIELTDNAGNHFAAELVALLVVGRTLSGFYARAEKWHSLAAGKIEREVSRQFMADGVNFEKSTAYHRLVLDLFMIAGISLERSGQSLSELARGRLMRAAHYCAWFKRPDNLYPVIGDTDDASVFNFDSHEVRDARPTLGVAATFFKDPKLKAAAGELPNAAIWLFGQAGIAQWAQLADARAPFTGDKLFDEGGVFIAKNKHHFLFVDVGEVGQNGLGGHGHNDLLSFELCLGGEPIVVDPGTYLYSGDLPMHLRLRSTPSHNGLQVDDEEIAPLIGNFRISDRAKPIDIREATAPDGLLSISAGHTGYNALADPVLHQRNIVLDAQKGAMRCRDELTTSGKHATARFLHFASSLDPQLVANEIRISTSTDTVVVRWDEECEVSLQDDHVCPGFGRIEPAKTLVIRKEITGNASLGLDIFHATAGPINTDVAPK